MQSTVQIFKLDEVKKGVSKKTGSPYEIHTAQAALVDAAGNVDTVGVLDIPPSLRGQVHPGVFTGTFAMKTNFQNGRIESVLVGLTPVDRVLGAGPVSVQPDPMKFSAAGRTTTAAAAASK